MDKEEVKYMSLVQAIEYVGKDKVTFCPSCDNNTVEVISEMHPLLGITVWNFPKYRCNKCATTFHNAAVAIAVENLKEKFDLHGGWYIEDLLNVEREGDSLSNI